MSATKNVLLVDGDSGENYTEKIKAVNAIMIGGTKSAGKVPVVQGDGETVEWDNVGGGATSYKGAYNATTNTPTIIDGTGTNGDYYLVAVAGTQDFGAGDITFNVGDLVLYNGTTTVWGKVDGNSDIFLTKYTKISATALAADMQSAGTNLIDASGGTVVMTVPDVTAGDTRAYRFLLSVNGNHAQVTTVGGTQKFGATLTALEIATVGTAVMVKANGVDGYEVIEDSRVYYRTVHVTANLDLSAGFESGAIYECVSATGSQIQITIPDASAAHEGHYAKINLATDNGTSVKIVTESAEVIGSSAEQFIINPFKGVELMDNTDSYIITQDSRPSAANVAVNLFPTDVASVLEGGYFNLDTEAPAVGTVTTAPITSSDSGAPQSMGFWINDNKALVGDLPDTSINGFAQLKKTSNFNRDIRIKFKYYEYDYNTDTLNPTPLSETNYSGLISNFAAFQEYFISGLLPANAWAESSTVGKVLVAELLAYKDAVSGDDPTLDFQKGTSRTVVDVPVTSVNHATLGGVVVAGPGTPDGHIADGIPVFVPELTTTQRDAFVPAAGSTYIINNTTTGRLEKYDDGAWSALDTNTQSGIAQEINVQTGTAYTLLDSDHGKLVTLDNAAAIALDVDTGLRSDFACAILQKGAGVITIGGTATVNEFDGFTATAGQWALASISHLGSDVFFSQGRLA